MICLAGTSNATASDTFFLLDPDDGNVNLILYDAKSAAVDGKAMRVKLHVTEGMGVADLLTSESQLINGRSHYELDPEVRWYDLVAYKGEYHIEPSNITDSDQEWLDEP